MSEPSPAWHSNLYALVPHPAEPRVLMLQDAASWSLPHVRLEQYVWFGDVSHIAQAMRRELGVDVAILGCVDARADGDAHRNEAIYTLEPQSQAWAPPPRGRWVDRWALAGLPLAQPEQRPAIERYLAEAESGAIPVLRPPWARPGWFAAASAWLESQLARRGYTLVAPVEQVKSWGISCILRARTASGDFYLKQASTLPLFADEPALTQMLAARYPEHIPTPIAVALDRGWMLLADFGPELRGNTDITVWEAAIRLFAQMQIASAAHIDALIAAGCLDRRLDRLAEQIDPLLNDTEALAGLDAAEVARLCALAPQLKAICGELASYGVPPMLMHGDLHTGNIAARERSLLFFDWTDGCIAHPFLDLITFLDNAAALPDPVAAKAYLRDAYLAEWTAYEPSARLGEMWALAEPLGALHQAISYQHILAALEPTSKHEMIGSAPYFLRKLLESLPE